MMRRRNRETEMNQGEDSFLDVIANLVGVLIILVAVVSMQAGVAITSKMLPKSNDGDLSKLQNEFWDDERTTLSVEADCDSLQGNIDQQSQENLALERIRHEMLVQLEIVRSQLLEKKAETQSIALAEADRLFQHRQLERTVGQLKSQLSRIEQDKNIRREQIVHYPTPIAKTVFANEIHFQISNHQISFVPIDSLLQAMKSTWQSQLSSGEIASSIVGTVGPQEGFSMQYSLVAERVNQGERTGVNVQFAGFELLPSADLSDESIADALSANSNFRTRLDRMVPGKTTVSVWVYPESYDDFMVLKEWLRNQGFQTAGWPLGTGGRISGGPNGLRTSAQ